MIQCLSLGDGYESSGHARDRESANPLIQLQTFGQSIWLDYIRRDLMASGALQRLITDDGLRGMTSNPSIFEKAIAGGQYQDFLDSLAAARPRRQEPLRTAGHPRHSGRRRPARACLPEHEEARRLRKPRSFPLLAHDTNGTSTRRGGFGRAWLAQTDDQSSGHREGIPAIRQLLSEGITSM